MKKYSFLIAFLIICSAYSQDYKGLLSNIENNGLHKIMLPVNVRAASNNNFNSLRIKNSKQEEVPYVLLYNTDKFFSKFIATEIITKNIIKDSVTAITIENSKREKLEHITLKIANTKITKNYDVYGSDDGKNWFGLVANKTLSYANKTNTTILEKTINFPLNNYNFIRIDFSDRNSLPINILEAGFYKSEVFKQEPVQINGFTLKNITLKDKKVTQLKFSAKEPHKIDLISFKVNTDFFLRNAKITTTETRKIKKQIETYDVTRGSFKLNSKNKNTFYISNLNEKEFTIEIDNQDNPPLTIENIQLLQKPVCIIANLKQKEAYELQLDASLKKPSYDLGNFISDKTVNIKEAVLTSFTKIKKEGQQKIKEKSFWQTNTFMWLCIVLGGILVVYFALGLLKDINKNNSEQ